MDVETASSVATHKIRQPIVKVCSTFPTRVVFDSGMLMYILVTSDLSCPTKS